MTQNVVKIQNLTVSYFVLKKVYIKHVLWCNTLKTRVVLHTNETTIAI